MTKKSPSKTAAAAAAATTAATAAASTTAPGTQNGKEAGLGGTGRWNSKETTDTFGDYVVPFVLMVTTPFVPFALLQMNKHYDGSLLAFGSAMWENPSLFIDRLPFPSLRALRILVAFTLFEYVLYRFLPGRVYHGPLTEHGRRPTYVDNAVLSFLVSHALLLALLVYGVVDGAAIFDEIPSLFAILVPGAMALVLTLYFTADPAGPDVYFSNSFVWDIWKGVQLHPRAFGVDVKQFINCRIAMMGWGLLLLIYCAKQHALYGAVTPSLFVSVVLQLAYIYKFFLWESGYMYSIDIIHDRAGFMIIWGVLSWLPIVYTGHSYYLIEHAREGVPLSWNIFVLLFGIAMIYYNYDVDRQRKLARDTDGQCAIWGDSPVRVIRASYHAGGAQHRTFLLISGWWGYARHVNYLFELLLALSWGLPAFEVAFAPYFYVAFLTILLLNRAQRDDDRCQEKYGPAWEEYKRAVPYSIIKNIY